MWMACGREALPRFDLAGSAYGNLKVEVQGSDAEIEWDQITDDGIAVGESISAADREMKEISLA